MKSGQAQGKDTPPISEEKQLLELIYNYISDGGVYILDHNGKFSHCFFCGGKPLLHDPDCLYIKLWKYMGESYGK